MYRRWLPSCSDIRERIAAAEAMESSLQRWRALRALSNCDHDFPATVRLDRSIGRNRERDMGDMPTGLDQIKLAVLSTSTTSHLGAGIRIAALGRGLLVDMYEPDFGQSRQELSNSGSGLHAFAPNAILIATDAYALFGAAGGNLMADRAEAAALAGAAVESLRSMWRQIRDLWKATVIQQVPFNPYQRLMGANEHRLPGSLFSLARSFQEQLRVAAETDGVDLIDLDGWAMRDGLAAWHSAALWHRSKQDVHPTITPLYGDLVARTLAARLGRSAKCLVLDLDNTVWGGVVGDDGLNGIVIGQGSPVGEGHLAFQHYAKQLGQRGIILAVCSKNDEDVARKPFIDHPDMVLREADIACFIANWTDKATNLRRVASELNIGLDAIVFADDNPFERELVRAEIPEVLVPELPLDSSDFAQTIADSGLFESVSLTKDDVAKTEQYRSNALRQALLDQTTDLHGYLASLDMALKHGPFEETGLSRIVQLINKTNQFNLTTRRYTEPEVRGLLGDPQAVTLQLRLIDRFGDNGIISVIIGRLEPRSRVLKIETWLMSCRVLGRDVEQAALAVLAGAAQARGAATLLGEYRPTERNSMVKDHYAALGFAPMPPSGDVQRWSLDLASYTPAKTHITIETAP